MDMLMIRYKLDEPMHVTSFGHVTQKKGFWHGGRAIGENILIFCTDGGFEMQVGGESFSLSQDELLLIPKNTFYRPLSSEGCKYYFLHFSAKTSDNEICSERVSVIEHSGITEPDFAYSISQEQPSTVTVDRHIKRKNISAELRHIFERASGLDPRLHYSDKLMLDSLLRELLILTAGGNSKYSKKLTLMLDYIDKKYKMPISLSTLSETFGLSQSYISRLFRNELKERPSEYINRVRISAASSLLIHSDMSITRIAEQSGFSDVYYFSRVFKDICGMSPTEFRRGR